MGNFQGSIACVDIGNCNNKAKFHLGMSLATNIILLVIKSSPYTMWPHGPHQSHNVFIFRHGNCLDSHNICWNIWEEKA